MPEITEATETVTVANLPNSTAWNPSWLGFEFSGSSSCTNRMQVGHQDSDLQLDGSADIEDEKLPESHSSSPNQMHDDGLSSRLISGDPVFSSVTINAKNATENAYSCVDNFPKTCDNGGTNPLIAAVAAIDICENKTGSGKFSLFTSKECCKQQEPSFPLLHCNEDSKDPSCTQDLESKCVDKEVEGKQGYQEGKCDTARSFQFRLCGRNSSSSSADSSCSQDAQSVINVCFNESFPLTTGSLLPALSRPCNVDATGSLASDDCSEAATESSPDGCRGETDGEVNALLSDGTGRDQNKIDCCTVPCNILSVPSVTTGETEIIKFGVGCEGMKVKLCPVESTSVSQACMNSTGLSVAAENQENTTSPVETNGDFSQFIPRSLSALSEDASKCTSQSNIPPVSFGISALVPAGLYRVFSSQDVGPSVPSVGIYSSCSIKRTENFSFLKSQLNSSVSKIDNFGSFPWSVTSFRNTNDTSQNFEDKTKFSSSCSLKNEQSTAVVISNESSYMLASESSSAIEIPSFLSISSDSCVPKITYKPSLRVVDSSSRESSPLSGFKFCTLGTPILSSAISQRLDARVNVDTASSTLGFSLESGKSFKFGAACTGSVMATALSTVTCTNMPNTSVQTVSANVLTQSSVTSASNFISIGGVDFPAITTKSLLSLPDSSAVRSGLFQQVPGVSSATSAVSVTKVTGLQFSSPVSVSLTKGTETSKYSQCSSKPSLRFSFQKSKPVKFTKHVEDNKCHLFSSSGYGFKSGTASKETSFGGTSSISPATYDFKSGAASNGFIFGGTSSQSPAASSDFKSGAPSDGFIFGGTSSQSPAASSDFKSGAASNGFIFGGTSSQPPVASSDFKSGAASNGFIFGGTLPQSPVASSDFKSGAASNGFIFGGTLPQSPAASSDFKSGAASDGVILGGTSSQSPATSNGFNSGVAYSKVSCGGTLSPSSSLSGNFKNGTTSNGFSFGGTLLQSPASSSATSNIFSFGDTSPQSPAVSSTFVIGTRTTGFSFGMPANPSNMHFNMVSSHGKSQHCSQMQSRSSDSAQNELWLRIGARPKQEKPFKAVLGTDTIVRDGCYRTVSVRHQHITAMRDYADLSFEELRLQYNKYTCSKQTENKAGMINREVQTTKSYLEDVNYMADILNALECPVCLEIVTSPVLQCQRGHHVCNDCWTQVTSCPLCKRPRSGARNYVAEAVLEKLLLPCKYHTDGCAEVMYQVDKAAHEKMCLFRTFTCLVDDCNQAYSVSEMVQHLKSSHCDLISGSCYCVPKGMKFTRTVCQFAFQSLVRAFFIPGWGLFYLCHKVTGQNTCLWMQMIGKGALDTNFLYSVEISDKLRSVAYQGPVVLLHTITSEQPSECLVITDVSLAALRKSTGFGIKVSIWEIDVDVL